MKYEKGDWQFWVSGLTPIIILGLMLIFVFGSCCRQISTSHTESDSIRIETRIVEREVLRTDTVIIELPIERDMAITGNFSRLQTSIAESEAWVDSLNLLHHTLQNKATTLHKEIQYVDREIVRDSIVYRDKILEVETVQQKRVIIWWPILSLLGVVAVLGLIIFIRR